MTDILIKPVLVIAAQPTRDRTVVVPRFESGNIYRVGQVTQLPSGKALNAARLLDELGTSVIVVPILAGDTGIWIETKLNEKQIKIMPVWIEGDNRTAYSIYDSENDLLTEIVEDTDGPIQLEDWVKFEETCCKVIEKCACILISGRGPKGTPENGYNAIVDRANKQNIPVYVDCYGPMLKNIIEMKPNLVKINNHEVKDLLGWEPLKLGSCVEAAQKVQSLGIETVIISMGHLGAVFVDHQDTWTAVPPKLSGAAIGSGDALMAGYVHGLSKGYEKLDAFRLGMALSCANILIPGACVLDTAKANNLIEKVIIM